MMPEPMEQLLTEALQDRATLGAPIDPARLMQAAVADGRRIRTRRRVVATGLAAVAVGATVLTGAFVPIGSATPAPDPSRSGPVTADLGRLPVAVGQPGAGARPDLVATDPRIVHFSVDSLAENAWTATWTATAVYESALIGGRDFSAYVAVSRDPKALKALPPNDAFGSRVNLSSPTAVTIGGRPGTVAEAIIPPGQMVYTTSVYRNLWALVWQPVDGLWATVQVAGQPLDRAVHIAETVRFDVAKKCTLPFTVGEPPAGTHLLTCSVTLDTQSLTPYAHGRLVFGDGKKTMSFNGDDAHGRGAYPRPLKAGPNQVAADPGGGVWTMLMAGVSFNVIASPHNAYTQKKALDTLATVRMRAYPADPSTW